MPRKVGSLLVILALIAFAMLLIKQVGQTTSTGHPTPEALSSPPDFVGWVLDIEAGNGQIHVESQADKIVRPVTIMLTKDTVIFRKEKGNLRQVNISDVHLKDQAELWLAGSLPSSFPAKVNARQIVVEDPF
jgi:hypothetical protein